MMDNEVDTHFNVLILVNDLIESIDQDILREIGFDKITIHFCKNLK